MWQAQAASVVYWGEVVSPQWVVEGGQVAPVLNREQELREGAALRHGVVPLGLLQVEEVCLVLEAAVVWVREGRLSEMHPYGQSGCFCRSLSASLQLYTLCQL